MGPTPKPGQAPKPPIGPFVAACHALSSALATFDHDLTSALHTRGTLRNNYLEGAKGWKGSHHDDFSHQFTSQNLAVSKAAETARALINGVDACRDVTVSYYNSQP